MRIGIIGSSGGSVVRELTKATGTSHSFAIVTDRACGLETLADEYALPWSRIIEPDNTLFSDQARHYFDQQGGVDLVLLFYLRLVTPELFNAYPTFNLHPSLLPEYRGFNAIERAFEDRADDIGATLHLVDEQADHGPIIAQVSTRLKKGAGIDYMHRISFAQKTYLVFYLIDRFEAEGDNWIASGQGGSPKMNPEITDEALRDSYRQFALREGLGDVL